MFALYLSDSQQLTTLGLEMEGIDGIDLTVIELEGVISAHVAEAECLSQSEKALLNPVMRF